MSRTRSLLRPVGLPLVPDGPITVADGPIPREDSGGSQPVVPRTTTTGQDACSLAAAGRTQAGVSSPTLSRMSTGGSVPTTFSTFSASTVRAASAGCASSLLQLTSGVAELFRSDADPRLPVMAVRAGGRSESLGEHELVGQAGGSAGAFRVGLPVGNVLQALDEGAHGLAEGLDLGFEQFQAFDGAFEVAARRRKASAGVPAAMGSFMIGCLC